jgi:hypothetical protein
MRKTLSDKGVATLIPIDTVVCEGHLAIFTPMLCVASS